MLRSVLPLVKKTETIDITPTWSSLLPYMLEVYVDGSKESKSIMRSNFKRMAYAADLMVEIEKNGVNQTTLDDILEGD